MKSARVYSIVPILGFLCVTTPALSQPDGAQKAMASAAFDEAQKLMAAGRITEACPKYSESYRLDAQLGSLLHLAECYERVGKSASAWASFKDAVEIAAQKKDEREAGARARVAELESKIAKLTITVAQNAPPTLEVFDSGKALGRAIWGWPVPVDPGRHVITARAPGRREWSSILEVPPTNSNIVVAIPDLQPESAPPPPPPPPQDNQAAGLSMGTLPPPSGPGTTTPPPPDSASSDGRAVRRKIGYVLGGAGIVGLGVGVVFMLQRQSKLSDRDNANSCSSHGGCYPAQVATMQRLTDDATSASTIATVGFIAGGAALAAGAALVISGWPESSGTKSAAVHPWFGPGQAGLSFQGGW